MLVASRRDSTSTRRARCVDFALRKRRHRRRKTKVAVWWRRSGGSLEVPKRLFYTVYTPTGSDWKIGYGFLFGIMVTAAIVLEVLAYLKRLEMRSLPPNFQIDLVGGATFPKGDASLEETLEEGLLAEENLVEIEVKAEH
ncbi:hypothetical protein VIGAN_06095200 [Vigna angularis var. angularis]|uniref:Uncharacterized protein n=1 Tax=Vigna angularis var. angularis TaxID=157739 RepID=A0A0S3SAL3_PHAAN|nr:hypothetical protein VIGAN_06095200 [Vigna angularis var. angularis]